MEIKHISHFKDTSSSKLFGLTPENEEILSFELSNHNGMKIQVLNYGATITSIKVPVANDNFIDVVLGFDNADSYLASYKLQGAPYYGATVGRYAGRIKKGIFTLNNEIYKLNTNNNGNALHGGNNGFSNRIWNVDTITSGDNSSITFSLISEDLDENFPGELHVTLTYTLTEDNELKLEYKATATKDTIINLTHHSYFNLDGHDGSVLNQDLFIVADKIVEIDSDNIPTGNFTNLSNHDFDFRTAKKAPASIDHSFAIEPTSDVVAKLYSSKYNLQMSVYTDQPSVHIYVGGKCSETLKGKNEVIYHSSSGICFETQNFPDAPNHEHFPNSVLRKGTAYHQKTVYKFENIKKV